MDDVAGVVGAIGVVVTAFEGVEFGVADDEDDDSSGSSFLRLPLRAATCLFCRASDSAT